METEQLLLSLNQWNGPDKFPNYIHPRFRVLAGRAIYISSYNLMALFTAQPQGAAGAVNDYPSALQIEYR